MKQTAVLVVLILFISLCSLPNFFEDENILQAGVSIVDIGSPDLFLKVEAIPAELKGGRSVLLVFEIRNKNSYDLLNVEVEAYDKCLFRGDSTKRFDVLKSDTTKTWTWTWDSNEVDIDRDCNIRFLTTYTAVNSIFQDIIVLSESEYQQRVLEDTIKDIPITSTYPTSPLQIDLRFSEVQPFIDQQDYYIYLNYYNNGEGIMKLTSVKADLPKSIAEFTCQGKVKELEEREEGMGCCHYPMGYEHRCTYTATQEECRDIDEMADFFPGDDYVCCPLDPLIPRNSICKRASECEGFSEPPKIEGKLLASDMEFINKRGSPTTCNFRTKSSGPLSMETMKISSIYEYKIDSSLNIKVKQ